ncbi:Carbohydrate kinase PfkB, partial [Dillenia turbinata]
MVLERQQKHQKSDTMNQPRGLIVGNYCHDVLFPDEDIVAESLGGAASFISNTLDVLSISCSYVSKVGEDFAFSVSHPPIISASYITSLFHAHFLSERDSKGHQDRVLKRIHACDPILPSDLPVSSHFGFGMAVGVAGEILPETVERILDICNVVFVDIQALIRVFDPVDETVNLVGQKESGFFHLLPRIEFLRASAEEASCVDLEEARKCCSVQIDPTGAGDSFLEGFVAGLNLGSAVEDATILGNFFGSLTVGYLGLPKFDPWHIYSAAAATVNWSWWWLVVPVVEVEANTGGGRGNTFWEEMMVKDEVKRNNNLCTGCCERIDNQKLIKPPGHERFHAALRAAKEMFRYGNESNDAILYNGICCETLLMLPIDN